MSAADLLQSSGRYQPILVYYPSAVFDQNCEKCKDASHAAYLWFNGAFRRSTDPIFGDLVDEPAPACNAVANCSENAKLVDRVLAFAYQIWIKTFPFLALSDEIKRGIYKVLMAIFTTMQNVAQLVFSFLFVVFHSLRGLAAKMFTPSKRTGSHRHENPIARQLLKYFGREWASLSSQSKPEHAIPIYSYLGIFASLIEHKALSDGLNTLFKQDDLAAIVLPEENLFYLSQYFVRTAHLHGIPAVVIPFTIVNTLEWAEAFYREVSFQASNGWNRLFAMLFPHWVFVHKGRRLILPREYILGCEYFGIVPDNPWLINSGKADAIASESEFMTAYYIEAGIRSEKIRLTGALSDDRLYSLLQSREHNRQLLATKYGIPICNQVILVGLPPNQFGATRRRGCEFVNFRDLVNFMIDTVVAAGGDKVTILINLHPRILRSDVDRLNISGVAIIDEPIENLVPLADVYIAVASATIRLGVSCGIPVVNYDAYQYDYNDYKNLDGVCEAKSKDQFQSLVNLLIHDNSFYCKIKEAQEDTANRFCQIDGKAGQRLLSLFDDISKTQLRK